MTQLDERKGGGRKPWIEGSTANEAEADLAAQKKPWKKPTTTQQAMEKEKSNVVSPTNAAVLSHREGHHYKQ